MFTFCSSGVRLSEGPAPRPNRRAGGHESRGCMPRTACGSYISPPPARTETARHDRYLAIQRFHVVHARFRVTSSQLNCICNSATVPPMVARALPGHVGPTPGLCGDYWAWSRTIGTDDTGPLGGRAQAVRGPALAGPVATVDGDLATAAGR